MNTFDSSDNLSSDDRPSEPDSVANDLFIHGLLEFLHKDTGAKRDNRINAVLDSIGKTQRTPLTSRFRLFSQFVPLATAAVLTLVVASVFVLTSQSAAHAMVGEAIRATQLATQLRYEIRITDADRHSGQERAVGVLNMRGEFLLVQIETPDGHAFIMGRDSQGEWSLRRDGSVERFDTKAAAPRWINLGESTILVEGLDALLDELRDDDYSIEHVPNSETSIPGKGVTQLIATRRKGIRKPGPDRINVWIEDDTALVEKLELLWTRPSPAHQHRDAPQTDERTPDRRGHHPPPHRGGRQPLQDHPVLLNERPRFDSNHHPSPPEKIVFQRMVPVALSDDQFSPPDH